MIPLSPPWPTLSPRRARRLTVSGLRLTYHQATVMRLWDFVSGAVLLAGTEATIPYLGSEPASTTSEITIRNLEIRLPGALNAAHLAPAAVLRVDVIQLRKLQPSDGVLPQQAGMEVSLRRLCLSAPCDFDELPELDLSMPSTEASMLAEVRRTAALPPHAIKRTPSRSCPAPRTSQPLGRVGRCSSSSGSAFG